MDVGRPCLTVGSGIFAFVLNLETDGKKVVFGSSQMTECNITDHGFSIFQISLALIAETSFLLTM